MGESEFLKFGAENIKSIINNFTDWRQSQFNDEKKLELLYLECKVNLTILDTLKFTAKSTEENTIEQLKFFRLIKTEVLELVLLDVEDIKSNSSESKGLMNYLIRPFKIKSNSISQNDLKLINALSYVYIKVKALKQLSDFGFNAEIMSNINLKSRLRNLKSVLIEIVNELKLIGNIKYLTFTKESFDSFHKTKLKVTK